MTDKELTRANYLSRRISELENFIYFSTRVPMNRFITHKYVSVFKYLSFGGLKGGEIEINESLRIKFLEILQQEVKELKQELEAL